MSLDRNNMGHFRSGNNGQIVQSFQASSSGRMNGSPVFWNSTTYGPAIYLWAAGDPLKVFRLVGGLFPDAGERAEHGAGSGRNAGRDAGAVRERQHRGHRHSLGGAFARRRRESHAAAGNPARVRRRQRDARALEQPAERRTRLARQFLEVQPSDGCEREGVCRQPVEQAGRLRPARAVGRQYAADRQRRRGPDITCRTRCC